MVWKVTIASLIGGFLCLDRVFLLIMVSRPVVAGPLVGWILNDPYTGLVCGALIELFWIDRLPIGTYVPPNDTMTAVIVTAAAIIAGNVLGQPSRELTVFALLALLPLGYAGQQMDAWIIRSNDRLAKNALSLAETADVRGVEMKHWQALIKPFIFSVIFIFVAVAVGSWMLILVFPLLPPFVKQALTLSYFFIPLLGIAVALTTIKRQGAVSFFCAAFVAMLMIWEWTHGFSR
ncbi:MAG: PTS sugar transporter subunit IIC [Deltaproteobacteria bacterium]|jgi:PTS system mannose-specific IIC component|nr:PTS sugar transporter subunit IIC [Deltaproteobacteria bacterium]